MEVEEKRIAKLKEMAGEREILQRRKEVEEALLAYKKAPSILQWMGLQRPE